MVQTSHSLLAEPAGSASTVCLLGGVSEDGGKTLGWWQPRTFHSGICRPSHLVTERPTLISHLPRPSQPEDYTSSLHWGLPSLPWQLSPQETQVGDQNFCVPPPPQPVPESWSLLSVSKLLSIGAHGADWGWMPTAVTPRTAEGQTQGQLSGHTLTAGGSWSCMGVGDCGAHCHIRKPAQPSSLEASPAPPTWAFPPAG